MGVMSYELLVMSEILTGLRLSLEPYWIQALRLI
jgi:hypothetical protein